MNLRASLRMWSARCHVLFGPTFRAQLRRHLLFWYVQRDLARQVRETLMLIQHVVMAGPRQNPHLGMREESGNALAKLDRNELVLLPMKNENRDGNARCPMDAVEPVTN